MAEIPIVAQSAPGATTLTDLYTVPASKFAVLSSVVVCNRSAGALTYRLAVAPAGAVDANSHYLAYGAAIEANGMVALKLGATLATTDVVRVYASSADLTFTAFGMESDE